jgi:hypothetical protein
MLLESDIFSFTTHSCCGGKHKMAVWSPYASYPGMAKLCFRPHDRVVFEVQLQRIQASTMKAGRTHLR